MDRSALLMCSKREESLCLLGEYDPYYALFLFVEGITPTTTQAYSPQTHGLCERFHKTMKQACFTTAMRQKIDQRVSALPIALDSWLCSYNGARPHSGQYGYGKTPWQTLMDSKELSFEKHNALMFYKEVADRRELTDKKEKQ